MPPVDVPATLVTLLAAAVIAVAAPLVVAVLPGLGFLFLLAGYEALGYGLFIPVFFVSSGMALDLRSMAEAPVRVLLPENAAALVGAGVLTVLVLPAAAVGWRRRDADTPADEPETPAPGPDGTTGRAVAPG